MSLYNMMNKVSPIAGPILGWLDIDFREVPRIRDAFLRNDGPDGLRFVILTRCGRMYHEEYADGVAMLTGHKDYLRFWDDPFDATYGWFEFRISSEEARQEIVEGIEEIKAKDESLLWHILRNCTMKEITDRNIEAIQNMPIPEAKT